MSDAVVHTVLRRWPVYVRYMLFPLLLLTHAPSTAHSQQLATGDTIRVRPSQSTEAGRQWTDATVDRLTPDTLWYQSRGSVSPMSMDNADIQRPTLRDHRVRGAQFGGLAGGIVGALIAQSRFVPDIDPGPTKCTGFSCRRPQQFNSGLIASAKGAAAGILVGGTIGWFIGRALGHWETVELAQVMIGDGNLAVSLRIRPAR